MNNFGNNNNAAGQKPDFLDKALDSVEKKFGGSAGQNTQAHRATNEKITDKIRETFEKNTGKKVPHSISN